MKVADFNYELPKELIAQHPYDKRDEARLMVLDKNKDLIEHKVFKDVIDYLNPGDCLVINNTKVIPARLYGKKDTGANVQFLLLKRIEGDTWEAMVKPGNKLKPGSKVIFGDGLLKATVQEILEGGNRKVEFEYNGIFNEILDQIGMMPLPPYITEASREDNEKYQTVYARYEGSAAAPTAGLHFTEELLEKIKEKGVEVANVTLHVGIGTFRPVKVETVEEHEMHSEHYYIKKEDADKINKAKLNGNRVIAVGTTSCRVLESVSDEKGMVKEIEGDTSIFIYPGYKFNCIDSLITNFHLPESTLIMLVSSLAGKDFIMKAYNEAVKKEYKFFSFGDAMIIL
jgi:S-adenosylmethionine:tRNA ribosyltransferase-isomerase